MPRREKTSAELAGWALWGGAGLLESAWLLFLLGVREPPAAAWLFLSRLGSAGLIYLACPPFPPAAGRRGRPWALPLSALALLLPGCGWLLWAVVRPASGRAADAAPADALAEELLEEEPDWEEPEIAESEEFRLHAAADIAPAADVLLGGDPAMKRGAIETLVRIKTPESIARVLECRSDPNPEVRFYATSALTNLKRDYETRRRAAEAELFKRPADAGLRLAIKRLLLEYAVSGLVDAKSRQGLLEEARAGLLELSERRPDALRLRYQVERELDPARALPLLDRLIDEAGREALPWIEEKCSALFRLGRHAEVMELLRRHGAEILATPAAPAQAREAAQWKSAALWWGHG